MNLVMLRLSAYPIAWIVMFLFLDFALMENEKYSGKNTSFLNVQEERLAYDLKNYWQDKPFYRNNSTEIIGSNSSNKNTCLSSQVTRNASVKEYKNIIKSTNTKTLIDYNDPSIMGDPNGKNDQDFTNYIRVKRNEPINDSIFSRQDRSEIDPLDSSSRNFCDNANVFNNSISQFEPYVNLNRRSLLDVLITDTSHLRYKRGTLSKNGERTKRVGNTKHSKHHVSGHIGNKKRGILKSSRRRRRDRRLPSPFPLPKSGNNALINDTARVTAEEIIEINQKDSALLTNNRSLDEQPGVNIVALPFMHSGKAELRVRIEKIPTNESSFLNPNNWTYYSTGKASYLLAPKNGIIDKIFDIDIINPKLTSNFDLSEKKVNKLTITGASKNIDYENNVSSRKTDFGNTILRDTESQSVDSALQIIKDDQNLAKEKAEDCMNKIPMESMNEDTKSRAKRNQEIASKNRRSSNIYRTELKHPKDIARKIRRTKHKKARNQRTRVDRAARSIEEIKELAEKLIIKANELQATYVNNRNKTLYMDSCTGKNADCITFEKAPRTLLEKQGVSSFKSNIATSNDRQHPHNEQASLTKQKAPRMKSFSASRFAQGEHRTRRRSRRKWGKWTDWSSCSVTCSKGRQIRWRHCMRDCHEAETEMEEKTCQLPACPPGKFLGIF